MEYEVTVPKFFEEMKAIPEFKHAVIAGGYLRDQIYGVKPNDVDIFIPIRDKYELIDTVTVHYPKFKRERNKKYAESDLMRYTGEIDGQGVDIIGVYVGSKEFGNNLIETFPWANQQAFHDGSRLFTSTRFDTDYKNASMTLVNCNSISKIPKLMEKFTALQKKLPHIEFDSDYILTKRNGDDWL